MEDAAQDEFTEILGRSLRRARQDMGFTLRALDQVSTGRFKPSVVGAYERGEREISIRRFCELTAMLEVSAPDLLRSTLNEWQHQAGSSAITVTRGDLSVRTDPQMETPAGVLSGSSATVDPTTTNARSANSRSAEPR